jgi:hypothetical protein
MYGIYSAIKPEKETVVKCPRKRRRLLPSLPLHGILWPYKSQRKPTNKGGRRERREEKEKRKLRCKKKNRGDRAEQGRKEEAEKNTERESVRKRT